MTKLQRNDISKFNERYFRLSSNEYTVYVEGDIDKTFWKNIFPKYNGWKPRIEILKKEDGTILCGYKNLTDYLRECIKKKSDINFILALDGDYHTVIKNKYTHKNIVMTSKYSLENYIFCPKSINMYMELLSHEMFNDIDYIVHKLNLFAKIIKKLIILDCVNEKDKLGIKVFDLSYKQNKSFLSIKQYVSDMSKQYEKIITENQNIIDKYNLIDFIRWKIFLSSLNKIIINKLNEIVENENKGRKNNSMGKIKDIDVNSGIYINCIRNCSICDSCKDYTYLKEQALEATKNLKCVNS